MSCIHLLCRVWFAKLRPISVTFEIFVNNGFFFPFFVFCFATPSLSLNIIYYYSIFRSSSKSLNFTSLLCIMPKGHSTTNSGTNSSGNSYSSYNGGSSYRYSNSNGGSYYSSGSGNFYTAPSSSGGGSYYQSTSKGSSGGWSKK